MSDTLATTKLVIESDRPFIDLEVAGTRTTSAGRFLVDSAGGGLLLTAELARQIGLPITGKTDVEEWGVRLERVERPRVAVSGREVELDSPTFVILETGAEEFGNMISCRALSRYTVVFDFPRRRFELRQPGHEARGVAIPTAIHPVTKFARVEIEINGERHGMLLDTGAGCTMISPRLLERWKREHPGWTYTEGASGSAVKGRADLDEGATMIRVPEIALGPFMLHDVWVVSRRVGGNFEDLSAQAMVGPAIGALGGNVLRHFCLEIDYASEATYLDDDPHPDPRSSAVQ